MPYDGIVICPMHGKIDSGELCGWAKPFKGYAAMHNMGGADARLD
jgi:hypothetical protein